MKEIARIIHFYDSLDHKTVQCALLSIIHVEGSSYRRVGARMLISTDGRWEGGISGGCLEGDAQRKARMAIERQTVEIVRYDTREEEDKPIGVGLGCNGVIDVLLTPLLTSHPSNPIELLRGILNTRIKIQLYTYLPPHPLAGELSLLLPENAHSAQTEISTAIARRVYLPKGDMLVETIRPRIRIIIYGDNYDVYPLLEIARVIGWSIELVGKRTKYKNITPDNLLRIYDWNEGESLVTDYYTAFVLMSHDYNRDKAQLLRLLPQSVGYIGLLGPRKRFEKMIEDVKPINLLEDDRIFNPIGLDIGAETPEEIAICIVAEITARFRDKKANSLRQKTGPIHDRN